MKATAMEGAARALGGDARDRLAVAGSSGTLSRRFTDPELIGRVEAKTGTIIGGRALAGYAMTSGGRLIVFAILINGDEAASHASLMALDNLVVTMVTADANTPLGAD